MPLERRIQAEALAAIEQSFAAKVTTYHNAINSYNAALSELCGVRDWLLATAEFIQRQPDGNVAAHPWFATLERLNNSTRIPRTREDDTAAKQAKAAIEAEFGKLIS